MYCSITRSGGDSILAMRLSEAGEGLCPALGCPPTRTPIERSFLVSFSAARRSGLPMCLPLCLLPLKFRAAGSATSSLGNEGFHPLAHQSCWKPSFPSEEVALPVALNFNGNRYKGKHIANPVKRAAEKLTKELRSIGVRVGGHPKVGGKPPSASDNLIAKLNSPTLRVMLRYMNSKSANYFAEVFGKLLAVSRSGTPGSIAKGARAIEAFAARHGVNLTAYDSSGLSYSNRVSPKGLTKLLRFSEQQKWGKVLRNTLPSGGEGTLEDRLHGVPIRVKTGTLDSISALSGWIRLKRTGTRAEFSIMSRGMPKYRAARIEDRIVKLLRKRAR